HFAIPAPHGKGSSGTDAERPRVGWEQVYEVWAPFVAALGSYRPREKDASERWPTREAVVDRLSDVFSSERDDYPAQTALRYYSAQAAAVILTHAELASLLAEWLPSGEA